MELSTLGLIAIGVIPSVVWMAFYLQEDIHPEPKRMLAFVFAAGALGTFLVVGVENVFHRILPAFIGPYDLPSLLGLAFIEEAFKFLIVFLAVRKSKEFDEPIDAMIYMITGALGFAAVENIGAIAGMPPLLTGAATEVLVLRFIGATLLHSLTAGLIGYVWALGILRAKEWRYIGIGLVAGTALHLAFNYLILKFDPEVYPTLFLAAFAFFILGDFEKLRDGIGTKTPNGQRRGTSGE